MKKLLLLVLLSFNVAAEDNDALAFEFINTEPEIIGVAFMCYTSGQITAPQYKHIMKQNMVNMIIGPEDPCKEILSKTKGE